MPKDIKGIGSKVPPEPGADHSVVEAAFGRLMPQIQPLVRRVDEVVRATIPGLQYAVKWHRPFYGLPELGWIIEIAGYHVSANVLFFGGADFASPPPLGTADRTRYVKLTTLEEAEGPELRGWLAEASRTPGWR
jgi:hypothetical protein